MKSIFIIGSAGFISSWYVLGSWATRDSLINLDKVTYSDNPIDLLSIEKNSEYLFRRGYIANTELAVHISYTYHPGAFSHFSTESHVARSIIELPTFLQIKILGTCTLLQTFKGGGKALASSAQSTFRFLYVATHTECDTLHSCAVPLQGKYLINPIALIHQRMAASDHFVRTSHETYDLRTPIHSLHKYLRSTTVSSKTYSSCRSQHITSQDASRIRLRL